MAETIPPSKPSLAGSFKAWAEFAAAAVKAGLHLTFLCLVLGAAGLLLWREATTQALHVDVAKDVQSALTLHGGDIDLGLALQDALNERLQGVRRIVEVQGLKIVGSDDEAQSVSFKPFGVDVTTDEVTRLTDLILNRPKPPTVRLELLCDGGPCTEAGAHPASLAMSYSGPLGQRREAYPLARGTAALRRTIRQAIQNTADVVLEQSEPGIASIWFLNRGTITAIAADQYHDDLSRAVGAAVLARASEKPSDCISDLVIGMSLLYRNAFAQGVAVEQHAAARSGPSCQVHLLTNIILGLEAPAYCFGAGDVRDAAKRDIAAALARLKDLRGSVGPDIIMLRIPAVEVMVRLLDLLQNANDGSIQNWCNGVPASEHGPPGTMAPQIAQVMRDTRAALPDHPTGDPMHAIVGAFWFVMRAGLHGDDLVGRVALDRKLLDMLRAYQATDLAPRQLDMLAGQIEMDIGNAVIAAFRAGPGGEASLAEMLGAAPADSLSKKIEMLGGFLAENRDGAIVALENGRATHPVPLTDPSDVAVLGLLGDADLLAGQTNAAASAFSNAVDAFVEENEAVGQLPTLADILARWASLRIATGACEPGAPPDAAWQAGWTRLGYGAPDVCAWQHDVSAQPDAAAANLPSLVALVHTEMARCPGAASPAAWKALPVLSLAAAEIQFIGCHDGPQARSRFQRILHSTHGLDTELTQALVGAQ